MPWKEKSIMNQKEAFIVKALEEETSFSSLCKDFGISRTSGYNLLKRYRKEGLKGLEMKSKAPLSNRYTTSNEVQEMILRVRKQYPTWGARKIKNFLIKRDVKNLPAFSTITEILKRYGYISKEESLKRMALTRFERDNPNDLWQMDFKGQFQLQNRQPCYPLTILDDHSRFSLGLKACINEAFLPVKEHLSKIFEEYGLPIQINVDNGRPWGNSCLVRYTRLTVWLLQLGILVTHSRPRHPQTNGKNERFHRTLKEDLLKNKRVDNLNLSEMQKIFNSWRYIYNYERPHEGIGMQVPADRYEASSRTMPKNLPKIEYSETALVKKITRSHITYKKSEYLIGKAFIGQYVELRPNEDKKRLEIYFGKHKIYTYDVK